MISAAHGQVDRQCEEHGLPALAAPAAAKYFSPGENFESSLGRVHSGPIGYLIHVALDSGPQANRAHAWDRKGLSLNKYRRLGDLHVLESLSFFSILSFILCVYMYIEYAVVNS